MSLAQYAKLMIIFLISPKNRKLKHTHEAPESPKTPETPETPFFHFSSTHPTITLKIKQMNYSK